MVKEDGVLLIQQEDDETYTWWLPVLEQKGTGCPDPEVALNEAFAEIRKTDPRVKLEEVLTELQELSLRSVELQEKRDELAARVSSSGKPVGTPETELLEQKDMCLSYLRFFLMTHPIEAHMGVEFKTVAFRPWRDTDGDGVLNCIPTLYPIKRIKE